MLWETCFDVEEAIDGAEAIVKLETSTFAAVLTDLTMPNVDGAALLAWIATNRPSLVSCTFVITGGATKPTLMEWLATFDRRRLFVKPCDSDAMATTITAAIEQNGGGGDGA